MTEIIRLEYVEGNLIPFNEDEYNPEEYKVFYEYYSDRRSECFNIKQIADGGYVCNVGNEYGSKHYFNGKGRETRTLHYYDWPHFYMKRVIPLTVKDVIEKLKTLDENMKVQSFSLTERWSKLLV